ncbi:MAG: TfoX/Sxy family protein [Ruminococcus sp.]|nr:TfoX/Sxy family protein [Ruminococcus sp.]
MPSGKGYLEYILEQLSDLEEIRYRAMMGEYILYYRDRIVGGIYDDRLLVKPVEAARRLLTGAPEELPYEGAKPMLLVEETDNRELLEKLFREMYDELPETKKKKR